MTKLPLRMAAKSPAIWLRTVVRARCFAVGCCAISRMSFRLQSADGNQAARLWSRWQGPAGGVQAVPDRPIPSNRHRGSMSTSRNTDVRHHHCLPQDNCDKWLRHALRGIVLIGSSPSIRPGDHLHCVRRRTYQRRHLDNVGRRGGGRRREFDPHANRVRATRRDEAGRIAPGLDRGHSGHVMDLVEPTLVSRWHSGGRAAGTSTSSGKPAPARARSCSSG